MYMHSLYYVGQFDSYRIKKSKERYYSFLNNNFNFNPKIINIPNVLTFPEPLVLADSKAPNACSRYSFSK